MSLTTAWVLADDDTDELIDIASFGTSHVTPDDFASDIAPFDIASATASPDGWVADCSNGTRVALLGAAGPFIVPARCKKLYACLPCREAEWRKRSTAMREALVDHDVLYVAETVTEGEYDTLKRRRERLTARKKNPVQVGWSFVNLPEGRTVIATADLTQPRGNGFARGRMLAVPVDVGLATLGVSFLRADASRRQSCKAWDVQPHYKKLGVGGKRRVQRVFDIAFPTGERWDDDLGRDLTDQECQDRYRETWQALYGEDPA